MQPQEHLSLIMEQLQKTILLRAKHCYTRQLVSPAKRCDFCKKTMFLMTLRCKDCRVRCHRRCAQQAANLCELAAKHKLAEGPESRSSMRAFPECRSTLESPRRSPRVPSARKDSTDSFPEFEPHQASFKGKRFTTRQRLSCSGVPGAGAGAGSAARKTEPHHTPPRLGRTSRQVLPSESSNRSSVSGYYSLESEPGIMSECDTPRELSVFDSFGPSDVSAAAATASPSPSTPISYSRKHDVWVAATPTTVSTSLDCHTSVPCASGVVNTTPLTSPAGLPSLVSTWPLERKCNHCHGTKDESDKSTEHLVLDWLKDCEQASTHGRKTVEERREGVSEWTIPHSDLRYGRCIEKGKMGGTYKGQWHGEVLIQTRDAIDLDSFLDEVSMLSMIRHENIALFMGACVETDHFAVVNSIHKGPSLYNHLHVQRKRLPAAGRAGVAHQVAQAMGYLHARGIVLGHLTSRCVYLEAKVKLSVTRVDTSDVTCQRPGYACLPRGKLSYLAPELLASTHFTHSELITTNPQTRHADVYAFGTLLFEIIAGRWPLQSACAESVIYQTCSGKRDDFSEVTCATNMKRLVQDCWSHDPDERPSFSDIVKVLKKNVAIGNMKHSLSEPDNLNRLGTGIAW